MKERKLNKWDRSKPVEILLVLIGTLSSSRSFSFQRDNNKSERDVWMKNEASWNWLRWNTTPSLSIRDTEARTVWKDATLTKSECKKNANFCRYSIDAFFLYMYIKKKYSTWHYILPASWNKILQVDLSSSSESNRCINQAIQCQNCSSFTCARLDLLTWTDVYIAL